MNMKGLTLSGIAAVSLLLPLSAYAARDNFSSTSRPDASTSSASQTIAQRTLENQPSERTGRERGERWLQQLDLTPQQTEQIRAIKEQERSASEGLRQQMQAAREQMESLLAGNASADQLRQQHNTVQGLRQQMGDRRFETMLQVREILTPEQRAQLAQMKPSRGERRGMRR
ncbi:MAG: Spy/CpxP family protein refolding chaperone [Cyanobacteriota bacterium]|nr:Spy/CpxP family protein refolding chaperone [Cyanobacteriota bacterium]